MRKPLVYVAGPYATPDPVLNTRRAITVGERLIEHGLVPLVPHLSLAWHLASPHDVDFWYDLDLDLLEHCDALVRFDGASPGADREVDTARILGLPVFFYGDWSPLLAWARERAA